MSAIPQIAAPFRPYLVTETTGRYDAGEQRSTPTGDSPGGFTQVDNAAILDTNLSLPARMLYAILRQHRNGGSKKCCPAYSRLCDLLGTTGKPAARTTVARSLKELLDAGLVAWERHGGVNDYCFKGDDGFDAAAEVAHGYFSSRSSARLHPKLSDATSEVAQGYSNNMKLTRRIEQENSAPTERVAPGPGRLAKTVGTPGQPTPTVEAKPTERERVPRAKRASADAKPADAPKPTKFGAVIDAIRAAGVEPVFNRGRDAKAVGECSESAEEIAAAYVAMRRGEWGTKWLRDKQYLWAVCGDMAAYRAWREGPTKGTDDATEAAAARGPDQAGRPGRAPGVQGATGGDADAAGSTAEWVRSLRARADALMAPQGGAPVPGVRVRGE